MINRSEGRDREQDEDESRLGHSRSEDDESKGASL